MKKILAIVPPILLLVLLVNGYLLADRVTVSAANAASQSLVEPGSEQAGPPWFDTSWSYRRPVMITNNVAAQMDYQVLVKLDATFDFGHAKADGSDLRVTAADGTTELSYWIEDWLPPDKAWVWVKVPSLDVGTTNIYLYYGNALVLTTADGRSTFVAYDGFEDYAVGTVPTGYDGNPGQWTRYAGNPVLPPGPTGTWDANGSTSASVFYDELAGEYRMYYNGWGGSFPCLTSCIGLATSPDGWTWTRHAFNPIIRPGPDAWDSTGVRVPMVWKEGPTDYRMIYTGSGSGSSQIGYATSPDGTDWTKDDSNPVFNDPSWANDSTENWGVIKDGTEYLMWYSNLDSPRQSGIAVSSDLVNWAPYQSTPIFASSGNPDDWTYSQFSPFTFCFDGYYYVLMPSNNSGNISSRFYLYRSTSPYFPESDRTLMRIAHMIAPDQWDSTDNDTPMVLTDDIQRTILHNNQLWTYYAAIGSTNKWQEGLLIETDIAAALAQADMPGSGLRWSYVAQAPSSISVVDTPVHQGVRSVRMYDLSSSTTTLLRGYGFGDILQGAAGAWMRRASSTGNYDIYLYGGVLPTGVAGMGLSGKFHYWNGGFHDTTVSWQVDTWYQVNLIFNVNTDTYDFIVFDEGLSELVRVEDIAFGNLAEFISAAEFDTGSTFVGNAYGDDYRIRLDMGIDPVIQVGDEQGMIDLRIEMTDTPDPLFVGEGLTYLLTISNNSIRNATGVVVTDTLPVDVQLSSVDTSQGECALDNPIICNLDTLSASASAQITIVVTTTLDGLITNDAIVDALDYDTNASDNQATATTQVQSLADLAIGMSSDPEVVRDFVPITYTIWLTNSGPSDAAGVTVTDTLPLEVTYISSQPPVCTNIDNELTCPLGVLESDTSSQLDIHVNMGTGGGESLLNQAGVFSSSTADPDHDNNYAELTLLIDNLLPIVTWIEPVGNGGTYFVYGEVITLLVTADDFGGSGVDYVWFYYYDPANNRITIDFDPIYPYTVGFDTSVLPMDYTTQTYARAYDMAGNEGVRVRINLFRVPVDFVIFLPFLAK